MSKLFAIGEALIDFIPGQTGAAIKDVTSFEPIVGGAPANVCGAFVKLGGAAEMITQLGADPFGDKILADFTNNHIGKTYVNRTEEANTSLAFVALQEDGSREFSFYRKPGADMLFAPQRVQKEWFQDAYALHFCSVSLGKYPMRDAHKKAIEYAKEAGAIISFDPNLRKPLWNDDEALLKAVLEFMPKAHILKISDEELEFITGKTTIEDAREQLFVGDVKLVIYTKGADGAECYTRKANASAESRKVQAVDTTGAGDSFIGAFLYQLYEKGVTVDGLEELTQEEMQSYLAFSNRYSGMSVLKKGAITSYPTMQEMKEK